jgi:cytochrome P450
MIARRAALVASVADVNVISRLAVNTKLPPSDVGDHLLAVMIAVRETTSSLLTWLLIELAQLPQTVLALADEAQTLDRAVTGNMRALLWETERRHSPNILSRRVVIDNFVTPYGLVPEGWHAAYSPAVNHLFPSLFGDPVSFRPARFGGQFGMRLAASLLTFGNGIHACPGKPFAELVAVTFMTAVLRDCRLTLTSAPPANARYLPVKTPAFPVLALLRHRSNS